MAGHSKWSNIKNKKEKTDSQRAKIFTKVGREISVAIREGGADPEQNSKLRDLIDKAKSLNVPNDNIERILKRASDRDAEDYEEIIYEGYGPSGIAVVVSALTDNRNRTAADLRHAFDKHGGNLGQSGSVMFMFEQKGVIVIENKGFDEEKVMEDCIEAGAEDFEIDGEAIEITTGPAELAAVKGSLSGAGYKFASAEFEYIPGTTAQLTDENIEKMEKMLDMMEDNDDVQKLWHNWEEPEK